MHIASSHHQLKEPTPQKQKQQSTPQPDNALSTRPGMQAKYV